MGKKKGNHGSDWREDVFSRFKQSSREGIIKKVVQGPSKGSRSEGKYAPKRRNETSPSN